MAKQAKRKVAFSTRLNEYLKGKTLKVDDVMKLKVKIDAWLETRKAKEIEMLDAQIEELRQKREQIANV